MKTLEQYIDENYKNKAEFAKVNKVYPQQVSLWLRLGYKVHDHVIMKPLRKLNS